MNRRHFLASMVTTAAGLVLPHEPKRVYSFPSRVQARGPRYDEIDAWYQDEGGNVYHYNCRCCWIPSGRHLPAWVQEDLA